MNSKAGSSGAAESKPHQYDVFINHRGPDVKKTFVAHLDAALRRDGFRPFLDGKDIGQGRHIFNSIDKALKGACVHVVIFSKGYAESKYCLNELCDILSSENLNILPIFYHVNPLDLRWIENGPFKEGFEKHEQRRRTEKIQKWKDALCKVADYRGFRLDEVNGNEELLIRSILTEVRRLIPVDVLPWKQRYGMEKSMKDMLKALENVSVLGLVGMGGIGKTTLAMEIYNHFVSRGQFERYCFLKDVRSSETLCLQQQLLKDLGHHSEEDNISAQEYQRVLGGLIRQKVLIVVDDIDHSRQFGALISDIQKLGCGSRVVITSRQGDILKQAMAAAASQLVYEVPPLNEVSSRHLFNRHAFLSETPTEGFAELAVKVVDACGGHPLSLEIIGASLFDKKDLEDREIWIETVQALKENEEVFDKLRSTYTNLPTDGDRAMFVDIACMLIGMKKEVALTIWKSCMSCSRAHCSTSKTPALVLRRLMDRSLVKIDNEGRLSMHDVLRDMGRDIVKRKARDPEEWTHLWDAASAVKVLGCSKSKTSIRGMSLGVSAGTTEYLTNEKLANMRDGSVSCEASQLTSMEGLHLLILNCCDVVVPDGFSSWPQQLRWLQWKLCCFTSLPSQLNLPNLVVLDLSYSNKLTRLWENDAHVQLPLLQTLDLSWCESLEELAEDVGHSVPKLQRLVMGCCSRLRRLPDSICHLTDLEHLDLQRCEGLFSLPDAIVGLVSLRTMVLSSCWGLEQLPEELGKLTNLETLDVSKCSTLFKLPASIGGLKMLKTLDSNATSVVYLPAEFGLLSSLTSLSLGGIRSVPKSFQGLLALTSLRVNEGSADIADLGAFGALKVIELREHATITTLPKSLGNLKWLVRLDMRRCRALLTVEALPEGLVALNLSYCRNLTEIPSLAAMRCLVELNLTDCKSLRHVRGLECLTAVSTIDAVGCSSIEGCRIDGMVSSALRECDVSGSKVGVAYNNRWLEREPADQFICCSGNAIPILFHCMANPVSLIKGKWRLVLEVTISSKAECIALIWCIWCVVINESGMYSDAWAKVEVRRGGRLVVESIFSIGIRANSIVYVCTLRREHHVVQTLQLGDQISVHLKLDGKQLVMVEGGVCVVHHEDEKLILAMNSEELSKCQSKDLAKQFGQLVLGTNLSR